MKNNNNKDANTKLSDKFMQAPINPKKFIIIMAPNILKIDDNSLYKLWYSGLPNTIKIFSEGWKKVNNR